MVVTTSVTDGPVFERVTFRRGAITSARFGPERILRNEPYPEHAGRLI